MKNILIVGTGALATLFAARLAGDGAQVTLLGTWTNAIEALNREGARLVLPNGETLQSAVRATADPADCEKPDLALVLVKAWQTERAARQLETLLPEQGLAVTLQNGLGNREILAARLGAGRVALGVTTSGATLLGPGLARLGGEGLISLETHPLSSLVERRLNGAGFRVEVVQEARALVWGKLVINSAINPLTALFGLPNGALLEKPAMRWLMAALARETAGVAAAEGVNLPFPDPVSAVEDVARKTASNRSSMFQDVKRGAPTEIEAISGAVVRRGKLRGQPVPLNWAMWRLVGSLGAG
jgi:2-dehydropantoate 2-reductase